MSISTPDPAGATTYYAGPELVWAESMGPPPGLSVSRLGSGWGESTAPYVGVGDPWQFLVVPPPTLDVQHASGGWGSAAGYATPGVYSLSCLLAVQVPNAAYNPQPQQRRRRAATYL